MDEEFDEEERGERSKARGYNNTSEVLLIQFTKGGRVLKAGNKGARLFFRRSEGDQWSFELPYFFALCAFRTHSPLIFELFAAPARSHSFARPHAK